MLCTEDIGLVPDPVSLKLTSSEGSPGKRLNVYKCFCLVKGIHETSVFNVRRVTVKKSVPKEISFRTSGLSCQEEDFARQKQKLLWHRELPKKKRMTALPRWEVSRGDGTRGPGKAAQPALMGVAALGGHPAGPGVSRTCDLTLSGSAGLNDQ